MRLLARLRAWMAGPPGPEYPLRRDLKPGTLFRYLYAEHTSVFASYVPPRHPDMPISWPGILIAGESRPGPGDKLTAVEILWAPPDAT